MTRCIKYMHDTFENNIDIHVGKTMHYMYWDDTFKLVKHFIVGMRLFVVKPPASGYTIITINCGIKVPWITYNVE
jgi:hypothetical protein